MNTVTDIDPSCVYCNFKKSEHIKVVTDIIFGTTLICPTAVFMGKTDVS
jgi:hypothetical protein